MEVGLVRQIDINSEMQQSYLDYAMSVIVSRALPDARDGLKPVHRRILHAMYTMGIGPNSDFKKSARIVGDVLGKYHPHGDTAIYDAMARMAQDFSMRYCLIEGQGNFGSIDGDPPAAMRYTEARMNSLATQMLADIGKDTADFIKNFDGSLQEPSVLPAAIPNLLVNGATGIAVGMATSIPPHNMGEICDALIFMLQKWSHLDRIKLHDLMKFIQGPDFPTGGIIVRKKKGDSDSLTSAYGTGRGKISVLARSHIEEMSRGRSRIIVTELPFQVNKASLIERIASLARNSELDGLADLRDETDRQGMRIVLELTKTADPDKILTTLYRRTPMQTTFSVIMLALVDGQPRLLTLKQALRVYIEHRLTVIRRRSQFDLAQAHERAHILEGYRVALKNLDAVIKMIRTAKDANQAKKRLMQRFHLSQIQANAILDMPLRRLSSLERKKIDLEYHDIMKRIKLLQTLLASERKLRTTVIEEIQAIKDQYNDRRRTLIVQDQLDRPASQLLTAAYLEPDKKIWVVVTADGRIYRTLSARPPRLAGRAAPNLVISANTQDTLYLFDSQGNAVALAIHTLPECSTHHEGIPINAATPFKAKVDLVTGIALPPSHVGRGSTQEGYLLWATVKGMVKKTALQNLPGPSAKPFTAIKVGPNDKLGWVRATSGSNDLILISSAGLSIRFSEDEIRPMGLAAAGVLGIRLYPEDAYLVGMDLVRPRADLFLLTDQALAKRVGLSNFPIQRRHGKGVLVWKSGETIRLVGGSIGKSDSRAIGRLSHGVARSIRFGDAVRCGRTSKGAALFKIKPADRIVSFTPAILQPDLTTTKRKRSSRQKS